MLAQLCLDVCNIICSSLLSAVWNGSKFSLCKQSDKFYFKGRTSMLFNNQPTDSISVQEMYIVGQLLWVRRTADIYKLF